MLLCALPLQIQEGKRLLRPSGILACVDINPNRWVMCGAADVRLMVHAVLCDLGCFLH